MSVLKLGRVQPIYRGEYDPAIPYGILDFFSYEGSLLGAKKDTPAGTDPYNFEFFYIAAKRGDAGPALNIKGELADPSELPLNPEAGDAYIIQGHLWVWDIVDWIDTGNITGPQGDSAYTVAVQEGFTGSKVEWLESLIGPQGDSAYEVAVQEGFVGTKAEWLQSLVGQGLTIKGELNDPSELPATGEAGDGYLIGGNLWVWVVNEWQDVGNIQGPPGTTDFLGLTNVPSALLKIDESVGLQPLWNGNSWPVTPTDLELEQIDIRLGALV